MYILSCHLKFIHYCLIELNACHVSVIFFFALWKLVWVIKLLRTWNYSVCCTCQSVCVENICTNFRRQWLLRQFSMFCTSVNGWKIILCYWEHLLFRYYFVKLFDNCKGTPYVVCMWRCWSGQDTRLTFAIYLFCFVLF